MIYKEEQEKLIYSIIHKYFKTYPNKEDLFQVGYIGYMKAEENYDASYGAKLSTYAYPYIYGEMKHFLREDRGLKVSRDLQLLFLKIEKVSALLTQKLGYEPSLKEVANYLGLEEEKLLEAKLSMNTIQSMDEPILRDGKEMSWYDILSKKESIDKETLIFLKSELEKLPKLEQELLLKRYFMGETQSETARDLNMSQVQVSRKEAKVLTKLRKRFDEIPS